MWLCYIFNSPHFKAIHLATPFWYNAALSLLKPVYKLKIKFKIPYLIVDVNNTIIMNATKIDPYTGKIELPKKVNIITKDVFQEDLKKKTEKQKELRSQGVEKD